MSDLFNCPSSISLLFELTTLNYRKNLSSLVLGNYITFSSLSPLCCLILFPAETKTAQEQRRPSAYDKEAECKEKLVYWLITLCGAAILL